MSAVNIEESELLNDSKYRSYVSQVERALKAFESTSEWADLISSLGKLNKVSNLGQACVLRRKRPFNVCLFVFSLVLLILHTIELTCFIRRLISLG